MYEILNFKLTEKTLTMRELVIALLRLNSQFEMLISLADRGVQHSCKTEKMQKRDTEHDEL